MTDFGSQRRRRDLQSCDPWNHAGRPDHGHHSPGHALFNRRRLQVPGGRVAVLSLGHGLSGCGGPRREHVSAVIVKTKKGQYFVLPDNGLITPVTDRDGLEGAHEITNPAWMIGDKISSTFHGRDIFSPAAAHLAAGEDWALAGPDVSDLVRLSPRTATVEASGITGAVIGLDDPFGSLITDIEGEDFKKLGYEYGDKVTLRIDKQQYAYIRENVHGRADRAAARLH